MIEKTKMKWRNKNKRCDERISRNKKGFFVKTSGQVVHSSASIS
jgi:hypothetical protein